MSVILFWSAVALVVYSYLLFPLLVLLRGMLHGAADERAAAEKAAAQETASGYPMVSIIVAAHNEADVIGGKIESVLGLDYPAECLELVVASDGSDDGTNEIVAAFGERAALPAVRLLALPRMGKASALNAAVETAEGEILVFSDANSIFAPHTLQALLAPFADAAVGGVAGNQVYTASANGSAPAGESAVKAIGDNAGIGERLYWAFDRKMKLYESRAGNVISATGALYALRRELFEGIPDGVTDDFYNSVGVIAQGKRLVFAPEAVAYEAVAASGSKEFGRKVRVMTRGLTAVAARRELLDPRRHGWYAWQLLSHKILRRLVSVPLLALALVSPRLWRRGWVYKLATLGQAALYGAAAVGALLERQASEHEDQATPQPPAPGDASGHKRAASPLIGGLRRFAAVAYYFALVNVAALAALLNLARGRRIVRW